MRYYIHTTLTCSHQYTNWTRPSEAAMAPEIIPDPVLIKGGANLATSPESERGRYTPKAVVTEVTEKQMEYLEQNSQFKKHIAKGFIKVTHSKEDPEDIAKDMKPRDNSAPLTPASAEFQNPDGVKPDENGTVKSTLNKVKKALG